MKSNITLLRGLKIAKKYFQDLRFIVIRRVEFSKEIYLKMISSNSNIR